MASPFKMGSISDIVNSAEKRKKPNKKGKRNSLKEEPIVKREEVVVEAAAAVSDTEEPVVVPKKQVGKKRKVSETENVTTDAVPKAAESPKKKAKGKRVRKAKPIVEVRKEEPEESAEEKEDDDSDQENSNENFKQSEETKQDKLSRTVFIGNLSANLSLKDLKKTLKQYGSVASIRIRSVAPSKETLSKKAAYLSKQIHPTKNNVNAYAVFKSLDSVEKALALNGTEFDGNIIQVDRVAEKPVYENNNSVFLGNLSFKTTENELREFFSDCGAIQSVRLIRDSTTGIGKGFGYVNFQVKDGVVLALEKNGQTFNDREIRIQSYHYKQGAKGTPKKGKKSKFQKQSKSPVSPLKRGKPGMNNKFSPKGAGVKSKPQVQRGPPPAAQEQFKGEVASMKKQTKKTLKSKIKSKKVNKQKKNIAEILSK